LALPGVPQRSFFGGRSLSSCTQQIYFVWSQSHGLQPQLHDDNTHIYRFCPHGKTAAHKYRPECPHASPTLHSGCAPTSCSGMPTRLRCFVPICASLTPQDPEIPTTASVVGTAAVMPACSVRDLGIYLDAAVSMDTHVARTVSSCFAMQTSLR